MLGVSGNFWHIRIQAYMIISDGRVVKASTSGAVDSGFIKNRVKPTTLKLVFTVSRLDAQHYSDSVENKPTCLLVQSGKALNKLSHLREVDRWPASTLGELVIALCFLM